MKKEIVIVFFSFLFLFTNILNVSGQSNKAHIVEEGQTLYSISKLYGISVSDLLKSNPQIEDNIIQFGQEIIIPIPQKTPTDNTLSKTPIHPNQDVKNQPFTSPNKQVIQYGRTEAVQPKAPVKNEQFSTINHIVKGKETLYAISKEYGVTVDQIKAWNHLEGNDIKIGSVLVIRKGGKEFTKVVQPAREVVGKSVEKFDQEVVEEKEVAHVTEVITLDDVVNNEEIYRKEEELGRVNRSNPQDQLSRDFVAAQNSGKRLQTARGTISWINTENAKMSDSYFALHKTEPVGTIIKVTNMVNKRVVFVKVIGRLPETSDNINITLRLSSAAKNALLLNGDKAYVDMDYYQ